MQNLIGPYVLGNEMWGKSIGRLKILDVQPHVLPNRKLDMPLCLVGMLFILLLNLLQEFLGLVIFFPMPLDHLHNFFGVISTSHGNG